MDIINYNYSMESSRSLSFKINIDKILFTIYIDEGFFKPVMEKIANSHNHGLYEVHYMLKGNDVLQVGTNNINLADRHFCIIFPNTYHTQKNISGKPIEKCCFAFKYEMPKERRKAGGKYTVSKLISEEADLIDKILNNNEKKYIYLHDNGNTFNLMSEANHEFYTQGIFYKSKVQALITQILINLLRAIVIKDANNFNECNKATHQSNNNDERILIIEQFFDFDHCNNVKAEDLAERLHISVRQLDRVLKQLFNMSFKQKLVETRIEVSKDLLRNTQIPIYKISEQVGYDSVNSFCGAFKKSTGMTPGKFRMEH